MKYVVIICLVLSFANVAFAQHDSIKRKKSIAEFALKNYKGDPKDRLIFEAIYNIFLLQ